MAGSEERGNFEMWATRQRGKKLSLTRRYIPILIFYLLYANNTRIAGNINKSCFLKGPLIKRVITI